MVIFGLVCLGLMTTSMQNSVTPSLPVPICTTGLMEVPPPSGESADWLVWNTSFMMTENVQTSFMFGENLKTL